MLICMSIPHTTVDIEIILQTCNCGNFDPGPVSIGRVEAQSHCSVISPKINENKGFKAQNVEEPELILMAM